MMKDQKAAQGHNYYKVAAETIAMRYGYYWNAAADYT